MRISDRISDQLSTVFPNARCYRLAGPAGDGRHPYCNERGAFLGRGTALLARIADANGRTHFVPRAEATLARLLGKAYGRAVDAARLMPGLGTVARALDNGDMALANIALVHAEIDPLPDEAAALRLAKADRVLRAEQRAMRQSRLRRADKSGVAKAGFDPDEPRVPAGQSGGGQWTGGGDASTGGSADDRSTQGPDALVDPSAVSLDDGVYRPSADDASVQPVDVAQTIDPKKPIPVVLPDGTYVLDQNGNPILMPSGVSLADNAALGEQLAQLQSMFDIADPSDINPVREQEMIDLFQRGAPMDYQRAGGTFHQEYVDFGNYDFGVVAAAAGYTKEEAIFAAGMYNLTGTGDKSGPWFNNQRNLSFISMGYDDYKSGKITGTAN